MLSGKTYLKIFKKDFRVYPKNLKFITRRRHEKLHEDNSTVFKRFYRGCVWGAGDFTRYAAEKSFLGSFAHVS